MSKPKRRVPQQDRGERRVAEVLEAAAAVIAEVGYEAATMTQVAERAGASIGALYQYFPNKDAVVRALRQRYGDELEVAWSPLREAGGRLSVKQVVERIFDVLLEFMAERPAYVPLLSAPRSGTRETARHRMRGLFAAMFRERCPVLTEAELMRVAEVSVQVVKGMRPLFVEAKPAEREEVVREFKLLLTSYLTARLRG